MIYYASRLSKNISVRQPEGYLICLSVPIARIGTQLYKGEECGLDMEWVNVNREEGEVFSKETVASFEGMPVTDDHPNSDVNSENVRYLSCGHAQNVRRGMGKQRDLMLADLIITDKELCRKVQEGKRDVSCGYVFQMHEENGKYYQREIRGNHIAIVERGRAGKRVSIKDGAEKARNERSTTMKKTRRNNSLARLRAAYGRDEDMTEAEQAELIKELAASGGATDEQEELLSEGRSGGTEGKLDAILAAIALLDAKLDAAMGVDTTDDEDELFEGEEDPLEELDEAIAELEAESEADLSDPKNFMVDPDVIGDEDEDEDVLMPKTNGNDTLLKYLHNARNAAAVMPRRQRRRVADKAMRHAIKARRGMRLKSEKAGRSAYDSIGIKRHQTLGRAIMKTRNPHYKKG